VYYRQSREKVPFFSYVILSQDRREDRPDTLIFQVTEDIMRFAIYIPFKILVANRIGAPELIFIPVAVNNIGDGLAEPVGVAFGRHKYSITALYHKGKFFKSKFTRSYEGSSCVFITTLVVVAIYYKAFGTNQFWISLSVLPILMTIAEAKAPHTNDAPFLALVGCSFLSAVFLL
jgi:dolichol kinase